LVNGRISERSYRGYRRIRPLMQSILQKISVLAVQSETYARRLQELGADPSRVHVTGSIQFDRVETARNNPRPVALPLPVGFPGPPAACAVRRRGGGFPSGAALGPGRGGPPGRLPCS